MKHSLTDIAPIARTRFHDGGRADEDGMRRPAVHHRNGAMDAALARDADAASPRWRK
ncbi:MAG: hypothetical protein ACJA1L_003550 [Paracoccaceae bacterium]|jgi:hypothetical protein